MNDIENKRKYYKKYSNKTLKRKIKEYGGFIPDTELTRDELIERVIEWEKLSTKRIICKENSQVKNRNNKNYNKNDYDYIDDVFSSDFNIEDIDKIKDKHKIDKSIKYNKAKDKKIKEYYKKKAIHKSKLDKYDPKYNYEEKRFKTKKELNQENNKKKRKK